ncbi:hypothetical protein V9T40_006976 [Parthenolecanium corni]|uniref:Phorbol-ester/DAG-type domain-containing protein n=1 Tax=Parthenolecanium corni TaxID=536013 RepID=A0AAN9Y9E9_9HEMI
MIVSGVSDFSQEFSRICEEHATNLQQLVANYRKKNAELKKERPNCQSSLFYAWETLLQEVEVDSQSQGDIANVFTRQVSRPLLDRSFHRKIQARKIFGHRDSFEIIISKAEEKLMKCRQEYKAAYLAHLSSPSSSTTLSNFIDAHNTYVRQLHATNGMVEQYTKDTLPALLQELEDVYSDLCITVSDSVLQGAESISASCSDRIKRYENLTSQCRSSRPNIDIAYFVKYLSPLPPQPHSSHRLRVFMYPQPPNMDQDNVPGTSNSDFPSNAEQLAQLLPKNELVVDYMSVGEVKEKHDSLKMEIVKIEAHIKQLQDALDNLLRMQQRSLETSLFNKVNELQEDISVKRYDIRISQIQLSALRYQKELFAAKLENLEANARDRKLSAISNASMKSKWLKAFKSLKTTGNSNGSNREPENRKNEMYHAVSTIIAMRKSGREGFQITNSPELIHQFQEYTYKKITPCDLCSQVLRGHTRQGLKCRLCKMNVHLDCQEKVTTKCQTKSRLLRRQKSTSEIETRIIANMPEEEGYAEEPITESDNTYQVIKQANEIKSMPARITAPAEPPRKPCHPTSVSRIGQSLNVNSPPVVSNSGLLYESAIIIYQFCLF